MRSLMTSALLAGLSFVLIGCGGNDAPSAYVGGKDADDEKTNSVTSPDDADVDLPVTMELQEPESDDETSQAGELIIGDAAPPISISKWVNGNPVESFAGDKVYVVEFWATWCGPCLAGMPHLASLQTEYGDKVTFIGVSAEEDGVVTKFMEQDSRSGKPWSEVLTYTIALDADRKTSDAYMLAAGQNMIPCAFIVGKTGKVEWIGNAAAIDQPLQLVVDGAWDLQKARNKFLANRESEAVMQEYEPRLQAAFQKRDFRTGVSLLDQLIAKFPENSEFKQMRFQFLLKGEMFDEANTAAEALIEEAKDEPMELDRLAWILATGVPGPGPDLDLALSAIKRAEELTESKNASILDTLGRVLFRKGNVDEAIAIQKRAVELADPRQMKLFQKSLQEFEAALTPAAPVVEVKPDDPEVTRTDGGEDQAADPPAADSGN